MLVKHAPSKIIQNVGQQANQPIMQLAALPRNDAGFFKVVAHLILIVWIIWNVQMIIAVLKPMGQNVAKHPEENQVCCSD